MEFYIRCATKESNCEVLDLDITLDILLRAMFYDNKKKPFTSLNFISHVKTKDPITIK